MNILKKLFIRLFQNLNDSVAGADEVFKNELNKDIKSMIFLFILILIIIILGAL